MKLSFITDEATQDFEEAVRFARYYRLQGLELRSVQDTPVDALPKDILRDYHRIMEENDLEMPNLAGSFFKCDSADRHAVEENLEKLRRLCDAADILGCRYIRGFAFFMPQDGPLAPDRLVPFFEKPGEILRSRRKMLLLEADPSVNTTNHRALAALLEKLDKNCFGAIFDPGNDLYDPCREKPYPDGYEAIRAHIRHIHIKDAVYDSQDMPQCVCVGEGLVGYPRLLLRLLEDGYDGWLSLETHYRKNAVLTEEQMRLPQGNAFSSGGLEATAESVQALQKLLQQAEKELMMQ